MLNSLPVLAAVLLAFITAKLIAHRDPFAGQGGRISSLDGLRGYLALFVFLHHGAIWYAYLHGGKWAMPASHVFAHLGQSSVAFFFMITGFLFFSKLLSSRTRGMDWTRLYVSRVLRLTPLYLLAMALVFAIVLLLSHGERHVRWIDLAGQLGAWLGFTLFGMPDINGVAGTFMIIAGVPWSLPYEWLFYFTLPLIALCLRVRVPAPFVLLSLAVIAVFCLAYDKMNSMILFPVGMASAVLVRNEVFTRVARSPLASIVAIACVAAAVALYSSAHGMVPLFLLSVSFVIIAGGNSLFGILTNPTSRAFGETAYSVYLLHGIVLFVAFHFVIGTETARSLTPSQHWLVLLALTPVVVAISHITFWRIEYPCMRATARVTDMVRRWLRPVASPTA